MKHLVFLLVWVLAWSHSVAVAESDFHQLVPVFLSFSAEGRPIAGLDLKVVGSNIENAVEPLGLTKEAAARLKVAKTDDFGEVGSVKKY